MDAFGDVVIDFRNSMVRVDGDWCTAEREVLLTFYNYWRQTQGGTCGNENSLTLLNDVDAQEALEAYDAFDRQAYTWLSGYMQRGNFVVYGSTEAPRYGV